MLTYIFFGALLIARADPLDIQGIGDTGAEEEVVAYDPVPFWPEKILLDTTSSSLLLVWFDEDPPKSKSIPFADVIDIQILPRFDGRPREVHLLLKGKKRYLVALGSEAPQKAQMLAAMIGRSPSRVGSTTERIIPRAAFERGKSALIQKRNAVASRCAPRVGRSGARL